MSVKAAIAVASILAAETGIPLPSLPKPEKPAWYRQHLTKEERRGKSLAELEALRKAKWYATNDVGGEAADRG